MSARLLAKEYQARRAEAAAAREKLTKLEATRDALEQEIEALDSAAELATAELRTAAGAIAAGEAPAGSDAALRKRRRDANEALEEAILSRDGIGDRIVAVERELEALEIDAANAKIRLVEALEAEAAEEVRTACEIFARAAARRFAIAKAASGAGMAIGSAEPVPFSGYSHALMIGRTGTGDDGLRGILRERGIASDLTPIGGRTVPMSDDELLALANARDTSATR